MYQLRHEKTGLELVWIKRDEENKTFGIGFQTIPDDSTGVFHILEHSVLCGSDRYPVKEPFVELLKNSMNTFLNAMTFPDKTVYPISSRNDKDFLNLTRVYLDAVFHPMIYSKPEIFYQEGWHHELDGEGRPGYKGVVYNEMRGAYADVDNLAEKTAMSALFPDMSYRFDSGGDPACIPDLTYEAFLARHKRCYSPSNAYVFLDGDVDIDAVLTILDEEYLAGFERGERIAFPALQAPVKSPAQTVEYELSAGEDPENKYRLVYGSVAGRFDEREKLTAVQVLCDVLCGDNQAPLRRVILDDGLAESVNMMLWDGTAQPWLKLEVRNFRGVDLQKAESAIFTELERIEHVGVDRVRLDAALSNLEFQLRERDYGSWPQGLMFGLNVLDSWMRGGAPELNLEVGTLFESLRAKIDEGYFEALIRELLLDMPHSCKVLLVPSHKAGEARRKAESDRLEREAASWSEADRAAVRERQEKLAEWQSGEDSPEALATLPHLELSDVKPEPEKLPSELVTVSGIKTLRHAVPSGGIAYVSLYFDVTGLSEDELSALSLMARLLGKLDTSAHTAAELSNRTRALCGNLSFYLTSHESSARPGEYTVQLTAGFSALENKVDDAAAHVSEILTETRFDNEQAVLDILRQYCMQLFQSFVMSGSNLAIGRVAAQVTAGAVATEHIGGFAFYQWLRDHESNWDWDALRPQLVSLYGRCIDRSRMLVSVTNIRPETFDGTISALVSAVPERNGTGFNSVIVPHPTAREGIEIPADVSFAALGGHYEGAYSGVWQLANRIVSYGWLWNAIRVQGGAYGCGMVARESGFTGCYSYRDPTAGRSLEKYLESPDFLRGFVQGGNDLTGFIIGAISDSEPLLTAYTRGLNADIMYLRGQTWEDLCARRRELLNARGVDLLPVADALESALRSGGVCVIGPRAQLEACGVDNIMSV